MRFYNKFWRVLVLCCLPFVLVVPEIALLVMTLTLIPCLYIGIAIELMLHFARNRKQMYRGAALTGVIFSLVLYGQYHRTVDIDLLLMWLVLGLWFVLIWAHIVWRHEQNARRRYPQGKPPLGKWPQGIFVLSGVLLLTLSAVGELMHTTKQTAPAAIGQVVELSYFRPVTEPLPRIRLEIPSNKSHNSTYQYPVRIRAVIDGQCEYLADTLHAHNRHHFSLYAKTAAPACRQLPAGFHTVRLHIEQMPAPLRGSAVVWGMEYPINFKDTSQGIYAWLRLILYQHILWVLYLLYALWFVCRKLNK